MKKLFALSWTHIPKRWGRVALFAALLAVALLFSTFAAAPTAHAAPATSPATCYTGICIVTVWATNVNVRDCTSTDSKYCPVIGSVAGGNEKVAAFCQNLGVTVTYGGYTNPWWMRVIADNSRIGWISNIFIVGGTTIAGVPNCNISLG